MKDSSFKVGLYLSSQKGFEVFETVLLHFQNVKVSWIVVGEDKNVSNDYSLKIKSLASKFEIPIADKDDFDLAQTDIRIAVSWKFILPLSKDNTLVILHDSLLPKLRGFNPLVSALILGEPVIGVTAVIADEAFDEGKVIFQSSREVVYPLKIQDAIDLSIICYKEVINYLLDNLSKGKDVLNEAVDQIDSDATYSLWRDDLDYRIDWSLSADEIERFINAVGSPYSGAKTIFNGSEFVVSDARVIEDLTIVNRTPGKIFRLVDGKPQVVCGEGLIEIVEMKHSDSGSTVIPWTKVRARLI